MESPGAPGDHAPGMIRTLVRHPVVHFLISILLTAFFLYLAFRGTDLNEIWTSLRSANYPILILGFLVMLMSHLLRSWRWRYFLAPVKEGIKLRNLFSGVMIGYFLNNVIPRSGELARPYTIARLEKIPGGAALGTIVVERMIDLIVLVLFVFLIPLVYHGPLRQTFPWLGTAGLMVMLITVPLLALLLALMVRRDWANAVLGRVERVVPPSIRPRFHRLVHSFLDGARFLQNPSTAVRILFMTAGIWGLYMVVMYISFFAFEFDHRLDVGAAFVVTAISGVGVAIPTPGGTGSYHVLTSQTLTQLFGVSGTLALSYATATHAVSYVGTTVVGLAFFLRDHLRFSEVVKGSPGVMR